MKTLLSPLFLLLLCGPAPADDAVVRFDIRDEDGASVPCRIHLYNDSGQPQRARDLPFWFDHFVCPGTATLTLPAGRYDYEIERGPEWERKTGSCELSANEKKNLSIGLHRIADLASHGWWSGELHVHRNLKETPLHLQAEDLHVAPVITWWNGSNHWADRQLPSQTLRKLDDGRYYDVMAGEDERNAGALLYFGLSKPLDLPGGASEFPEFPSPMKFVHEARKRNPEVWIDIEKPFWRDTPVWLASGQINSVGLANNHMCRSSMYEDEAWGKPRDAKRLPPPLGNGLWTQQIYYHVLNCGLRVPPSAGSASGVLPNPVGYNRAYVHLEHFSYIDWWNGLRAGRCFVTNGPLLLCRANGQLPGHVFTSKEGDEVTIDLNVELISKDRVPKLEIVKNGRVEQAIEVTPGLASEISAQVSFDDSGWFLVRAIADNDKTLRFASTAPYYFEVGLAKRRISKASAQFFLDWIDERVEHVKENIKDPVNLPDVLKYHQQARDFWKKKVDEANAD